jgi:hypothetical protein
MGRQTNHQLADMPVADTTFVVIRAWRTIRRESVAIRLHDVWWRWAAMIGMMSTGETQPRPAEGVYEPGATRANLLRLRGAVDHSMLGQDEAAG